MVAGLCFTMMGTMRFTTGLADEVQRSGWEVMAYCWMPNHIHVLLRTPEPNLASGMQHWLSPPPYPGYARRTARNAFVQYDTLHQAWRGECGGKDAASAYCRYVTEGLAGAAENPLTSALGEWVIGSRDFLNRMVALAAGGDQADQVRVRLTRRMGAMSVDGGRGYPSGRSSP